MKTWLLAFALAVVMMTFIGLALAASPVLLALSGLALLARFLRRKALTDIGGGYYGW